MNLVKLPQEREAVQEPMVEPIGEIEGDDEGNGDECSDGVARGGVLRSGAENAGEARDRYSAPYFTADDQRAIDEHAYQTVDDIVAIVEERGAMQEQLCRKRIVEKSDDISARAAAGGDVNHHHHYER